MYEIILSFFGFYYIAVVFSVLTRPPWSQIFIDTLNSLSIKGTVKQVPTL